MSELYVLFRVAESTYGLPASSVIQLESFAGATRVPGTADHVEGLVQVRSAVVPVINLRKRFGLDLIEPSLDSRVIVVQRGERLVGLLADSAREVFRLEASALQPAPEAVVQRSQRFVQQVANHGGRIIMIIDCDRVIGQEEIHGQPLAH